MVGDEDVCARWICRPDASPTTPTIGRAWPTIVQMGDAVGACADTMTARPHRPNIVATTGFLIAYASEATQPDPATRMLTRRRTDTVHSFWALNSTGMMGPRPDMFAVCG